MSWPLPSQGKSPSFLLRTNLYPSYPSPTSYNSPHSSWPLLSSSSFLSGKEDSFGSSDPQSKLSPSSSRALTKIPACEGPKPTCSGGVKPFGLTPFLKGYKEGSMFLLVEAKGKNPTDSKPRLTSGSS